MNTVTYENVDDFVKSGMVQVSPTDRNMYMLPILKTFIGRERLAVFEFAKKNDEEKKLEIVTYESYRVNELADGRTIYNKPTKKELKELQKILDKELKSAQAEFAAIEQEKETEIDVLNDVAKEIAEEIIA